MPENMTFQPINGHKTGLKHRKKSKFLKLFFIILAAFFAIAVGSSVAFFLWMKVQLSPLDANSTQSVELTIDPGMTTLEVADQLEERSIIKSSTAFNLYVRYVNKNNNLQAGRYAFSPSESVQQIVKRLIEGDVEQASITFFPGATLVDNYTSDETKRYDVTTILKRAGYSETDIIIALSKTYDSPLFVDKPDGADLEGYVYGETYSFNEGAGLEDILQASFDEFYSVVQENNLIDAFAAHGLNLYEGITLASIVQREAGDAEDQKQVAQVFYSRLESGMALGSDVTYQYIADKLGIERDVNLDSPYNTRRFAGLPPGPISAPGLSALLAVANPADGDYLFFLAGDDDVVYFAKTQAEHESNIVNHCQIKCSTL